MGPVNWFAPRFSTIAQAAPGPPTMADERSISLRCLWSQQINECSWLKLQLTMFEPSANLSLVKDACDHSIYWAVVVVKWSACLPYSPTIQVQILLKPTNSFSEKLCLKMAKINTKRQGLAHFQNQNKGALRSRNFFENDILNLSWRVTLKNFGRIWLKVWSKSNESWHARKAQVGF